MIGLISRIIRLLIKLGVLKCAYKCVYTGKGVSLNEFYKQGHWSKRSRIKNQYRELFENMIDKAKIKWMDQFSLVMFYNSRHDPDNVVGMEKVFMDTLKGKYMEDDNKKFFRGFAIFPDESLPMNTFEFYLLPHGTNKTINNRRRGTEVVSGQTEFRF